MNEEPISIKKQNKRRKSRVHVPFTDWIFLFSGLFFSLITLGIFLIQTFNHIWKIDIELDIDPGVEWFILFVSIVFLAVAIGFSISIFSRILFNSKLRKAEKKGNRTLGHVSDFIRMTSSTYITNKSYINSTIRVNTTYTYYAKIQFVSESGETIEFTENTPLTKDEMNQLLEMKSVDIKTYKNVCVLDPELTFNIPVFNDHVKDMNSLKHEQIQSQQEIKIDYNSSPLSRNKANIKASIICIILLGVMSISALYVGFNIIPLFIVIPSVLPLFAVCVYFIFYIKRCKINCDCIKYGVKQKAKDFELIPYLPPKIKLTFTNSAGIDKTYTPVLTKIDYGKLKDAKEIHVLVYKDYAFPDFNELERHIKEIK